MGFRTLRVINEDRVAPGQGFGTHPHRDMEIISYVLEGGLEHKDSMGTRGVIRPGDVQRMSAGTGVLHSEQNASRTEPVHFLQIWLLPAKRGIEPGYEQKAFPREEKQGHLRLIAAPDGRDGSVKVHTDAKILAGCFAEGEAGELSLEAARHAWVQVVRGRVRVNGESLEAGDGAQVSDESNVKFEGVDDSEVLVFDLP